MDGFLCCCLAKVGQTVVSAYVERLTAGTNQVGLDHGERLALVVANPTPELVSPDSSKRYPLAGYPGFLESPTLTMIAMRIHDVLHV